MHMKNFDHTRTRTWNHLIRSQAFYPLNYAASCDVSCTPLTYLSLKSAISHTHDWGEDHNRRKPSYASWPPAPASSQHR